MSVVSVFMFSFPLLCLLGLLLGLLLSTLLSILLCLLLLLGLLLDLLLLLRLLLGANDDITEGTLIFNQLI